MIHSLPPPPPLDPQIAEFVRHMRADAVRHPPREQVPIAEAREIAEQVRKPWRVGGPDVALTTEHAMPSLAAAAAARAVPLPALKRPCGRTVMISSPFMRRQLSVPCKRAS